MIAVLLLPSVIGCGRESNSDHRHQGGSAKISVRSTFKGDYPIRVVVTTGQVADLVRHVGGKHVQVVQLMEGDSIDPHTYQPTAADVEMLKGADVIFYSGLHLEGKMSDVFVKMARRKETFAVTENIDDERVMKDEENAHDPHLWFDVMLWSGGTKVVADVLRKYDPKHADEYQQNAKAYQAELAKLDDWVRKTLASIPKQRRVMVTAHDAFRYFGRAYDIEVRGLQGISTESETGLKRLNGLVDFLVARKVKAVFVEKSIGKEKILPLIEGCQHQGHEVIVGGELYSDSMGELDTPEGSYVGMIRYNVKTIVRALK